MTRRNSLARAILMRLLAILLGLTPLMALEGMLRIAGWGVPDAHVDPFVGFSDVVPLFQLSGDGSEYVIAPNRQKFFCEDRFAAHKDPQEFRIFCLGGSTVQGRPYAIDTAFTRWLELSLQTGQPARNWRVVNCGGVSYASYRLVPVLEEVLQYQPDLIVLYTGHNEFLEDRQYGAIRDRPAWLQRMLERVGRLRVVTVLAEAIRHQQNARQTPQSGTGSRRLPAEVDAVLDYEGGLAAYHWDRDWRAGVMRHFALNVQRMVQLCRQADVPIILANPVCNLSDSPPFKSEHRADLSDRQLANWDALRSSARDLFVQDVYGATELLREACEVDPQHAGGHYDLANCLQNLGLYDEARRHYILAKDTDVCPLRILEPMRESLLSVAQRYDVPMIDCEARFEQLSENSLVGGTWMVDHVHPTIEGHQVIAQMLAQVMADEGWFRPEPGWPGNCQSVFDENLQSLDDLYFIKGMQRLENLRRWSQGRGDKTPRPWRFQ